MPNLRGASPVGRGEGGRRARQRCRTPEASRRGTRRTIGARRAMMCRGGPNDRSEHGVGGWRRPGSVPGSRGRSGRSGPVLGRPEPSGPVRTV